MKTIKALLTAALLLLVSTAEAAPQACADQTGGMNTLVFPEDVHQLETGDQIQAYADDLRCVGQTRPYSGDGAVALHLWRYDALTAELQPERTQGLRPGDPYYLARVRGDDLVWLDHTSQDFLCYEDESCTDVADQVWVREQDELPLVVTDTAPSALVSELTEALDSLSNAVDALIAERSALQAGLASAQDEIAALEALLADTPDAAYVAELEAQVMALEASEAEAILIARDILMRLLPR